MKIEHHAQPFRTTPRRPGLFSDLKIPPLIFQEVLFFHLYKEWDCVESSDDYSVVDVSGQDVKRSCAALHDLLHADSLLKWRNAAVSAKSRYDDLPVELLRHAATHHKLLLCAPHAGASLCVLVCSDQQLDQSGDGALLPQGSVVCGAQGQVPDQTHCSLGRAYQWVYILDDLE